MKYRRLLALVISVVLLITAVPAAAEEIDNTLEIFERHILPKRYYFRQDIDSVILSDMVLSVGDMAFRLSSLKEIEMSENLTDIGSEAFSYTDIVSIDIPEKVTEIKEKTFYGCNKLETVSIGKGVEKIADNAFSYCRSLKEITVNPENPYYCSVDGVLYSKDMTELVKYPGGRDETAFAIPHNVETVADEAFDTAQELKELQLSYYMIDFGNNAAYLSNIEKFTTIPGYSRYYLEGEMLCNRLTNTVVRCPVTVNGSVSIPDGMKNIGEYAFANCSGITEITLHESIETIGKTAFMNCSELSSIDLPNKLTVIEDRAFEGCTGLSGIILPKGISKVGYGAFNYCDSLEYIVISDTPTAHADIEGLFAYTYDDWYVDIIRLNAKVYCFDATVAESFVVKYSIPYVKMPESNTLGDVDGDGTVNLADVTEVLKFVAEWSNSLNLYTADVTDDGKVNLADVSLLLKYIAGWNVELK